MNISNTNIGITGYKVAHLFVSENLYTFSYLKFLEKNFDISSCLFIFRGKSPKNFDYPIRLKERIIKVDGNLGFIFTIIPLLRKCDRIILHQLPYGPSLFVWNLLPRILARTTWIIWGGDVYIYRIKQESLLKYAYEFLRKRIIVRIPLVASFIPGDFEIVRQVYNSKADHLQSMYPLPVDFLNFPVSDENKSLGGIMNILVGNSGDESNRHIETLHSLEFLKNSNVRVFCPLSYSGNPDYINSVIKTGYEIFGDKFIPLTEIMEPVQYLRLLCDVDIAVMNHNRQQGLGNILPLLYFGKKVFLRNDTTTSEYLRNIGCSFYDIQSIGSDQSSFLRLEKESLVKNTMIIRELLSEKNCVNLWIPILNIPVLQ
jgi:dTDP-N-acetylfucosamine:lipid II N-acetylfucosaminyltransferase